MSETQELPVGPELDAAVARALGWTIYDGNAGTPPNDWPGFVPNGMGGPVYSIPLFSRAPANAWEVVEYLRRKWNVSLDADAVTDWIMSISKPHPDGLFFIASAPTMPEAVCRAVLAAREVL